MPHLELPHTLNYRFEAKRDDKVALKVVRVQVQGILYENIQALFCIKFFLYKNSPSAVYWTANDLR